MIPASVEVLLAAGEADEAGVLVAEMQALVVGFGCPALQAMACYGAGSHQLSTGRPAQALVELRRAAQLWAGLSAPYEVGRSRLLVGRALLAMGDEDSATAELAQARRTFEELGAAPAQQEVALVLQQPVPAGLTAREVEVLRLVAAGHTNPEVAAMLVLSEKTVARHLSNIFVKIDVPTRTAAAAFAYEHHIV